MGHPLRMKKSPRENTAVKVTEIVKRLNDECRLKAIKEKAEAKGAKDARRASELNRRQAESGALVEALSVIRALVDGRAEKPTKEITLEPDSQSEPDEGSDFADST